MFAPVDFKLTLLAVKLLIEVLWIAAAVVNEIVPPTFDAVIAAAELRPVAPPALRVTALLAIIVAPAF